MAHMMFRSAEVSECGHYRYLLTRDWDCGDRVTFVMLNPSTADGTWDDPTIRRCVGFAQLWGFGGMDVVNLFALRSTNPEELRDNLGNVGPRNDEHIQESILRTQATVAAWGGFDEKALYIRARTRKVQAWLPRGTTCLGLTQGGSPKHPLFMGKDTPRVIFGLG